MMPVSYSSELRVMLTDDARLHEGAGGFRRAKFLHRIIRNIQEVFDLF